MTYFDFTDFTRKPSRIKYIDSLATSSSSSSWVMTVEGLSTSPHYIDAAGFSKEDVSAEVVCGNSLYIKCRTKNYGERSSDITLSIPENVDTDTIEVSINDGVITITFDEKRKEAKKIKVK